MFSSYPPTPNDPSMRSTWSQIVELACGWATVALALGKSIRLAAAAPSYTVVPSMVVAGLAGYFLADLISGVYHWVIDNYGDPSMPVFGPQISNFQEHHKWPLALTWQQVANRLHKIALVMAFFLFPLILLCRDAALLSLIASFGFFAIMSQQTHSWAHCSRSQLHPIIVALQDAGVILSHAHHRAHHGPRHDNSYCILSGVWNRILDENRVFKALEMALYVLLGVRPRSWSKPGSEQTEDAGKEGEVTSAHAQIQ
ncbi:hypothetical protein MLD38_035266 [Melastoma candidum]|uniref:Uncharacterized protein n=1 Tax=Melastoma candidum TaxID=119954 RepID=A0ACB9MC82_9MYRT|nr:hypothetical protein MLD38_035266 [Melastoma candidum]